MFGLLGFFSFGFAKNETVVKEVIQNHSDNIDQHEDTGAFNEGVIEGNVDSEADIVGEFVKGCDEAKEPSEPRAKNDGEEGVPKEKISDADFGGGALLPGNFGMKDVGEDGGDRGGNKRGEPEEIIVVNDGEGEESVEEIVGKGEDDADDKKLAGAFGGGGFWGILGGF